MSEIHRRLQRASTLVLLIAAALAARAWAADAPPASPPEAAQQTLVVPPPSAQAAAPAVQRGVINFTEGHRYEGEHRDGTPNGRGVMIYPNRDRYEGDWRQGSRDGRGAVIFASGERYEGEWRDDRITGTGAMTWPNGDRYQGQFIDGARNGRGVMVYADGGRYEGEWRDNLANGRGTMQWSNGQRYEGEWLNGNRHGQGLHVAAPGKQYQGEWRDDKPADRNFDWGVPSVQASHSAAGAQSGAAAARAQSQPAESARAFFPSVGAATADTYQHAAGLSAPSSIALAPSSSASAPSASTAAPSASMSAPSPGPVAPATSAHASAPAASASTSAASRSVSAPPPPLSGTPFVGVRKRLAVLRLENKVKTPLPDASWQIGEGLTEMLTTELFRTGRFVMVERAALTDIVKEQELGQTGLVQKETAAKVGELLGAQLLVTGAVTEFEANASGGGSGLGFAGFNLSVRSNTAHVAVDIRLVDANTGQIVKSQAAEAKAEETGFAVGATRKGMQFGGDAFQKTPLGQATREAIAKAVGFIVSEMERVPWTGRVVQAKGEEVVVNAGANMNLKPGIALDAFAKGEDLIDPGTGLTLGSRDAHIGTVTLNQVEERFSIGTFAGRGALKRGDTLKLK